ncbi:exodeoxyribonuclease I [Candidatus Saccharibacteria bacterium]|nr:exodeoxyribonuclease I [Candidatus Saccharibacteria bacterium]
MAHTFFFYDLETSGLNARTQRIMQFAGQRTDANLKPIGDPVNVLVKLSDDILPEPFAITVTGITPQATLADGMSEPEFAKLLIQEIFTSSTIAVGYNNVRFDDEFVRHTLWRNFYDPYEWAWSEGRGRWDMLDVVRLTRALRPDGIEWPVDNNGKATNRLELVAKANNLLHTKAHDALSDVEALIAMAQLLHQKQPKLFDYMFSLRGKNEVAKLVNLNSPQPFVYSSGRYGPEHQFTTVAYPIAPGTRPNSVIVYDLRFDPTQFASASPQALASILLADKRTRMQDGFKPLPVKELTFNKCPAVAPLGVLDAISQERLHISMELIQKNLQALQQNPTFGEAVRTAYEMREPYDKSTDVENQLYDSFIPDKDKIYMDAVRKASANDLADFHLNFIDVRMSELLLRYKARWFSDSLSEDEHLAWEKYRAMKISAELPGYLQTLTKLAESSKDTYVLEELQLWAESIAPSGED